MGRPPARVALVTGASAGLGLATAAALARRGHAVRLVGRDPARLEAARRLVAVHDPSALAFRADLARRDEVHRLAAAILARDEGLHVIVHNAGVWNPRFRRTPDGVEETFAVHALAPFALTQALRSRLRASGDDVRVVHVNSRLHAQAGQTATRRGRAVHLLNVLGVPVAARGARLDLDAVDREEGYRGLEAYARAKLAQLVLSCELARREPAIASNAVHPGSVATDVTREDPLLHALAPLARPFLRTPTEAAETVVRVAVDPCLRGVSGRYFTRAGEGRPAEAAHDRALAARLWALAEAWAAG